MSDFSHDQAFDHTCLYCDKKMDSLTGPNSEPGVGDVAICILCAGIGIFDSFIKLRKPSEEERAKLMEDPDVRHAVQNILIMRSKS